MKMFYIKPEIDIELVEVESMMAVSKEIDFGDGSDYDPNKPIDAPEFIWE
ncbi:MAG: hypothetical protein J5661_08425 [Bacteroidaceae bacterium]|nr:hypothetical protein [Bacteroidaceae bacterium]